MALDANALVTLVETKAFLDITSASDDTTLEGLIDAASFALEGHCGYRLKSRAYADKLYDGTGTPELWLEDFPVTAVASVETLQSVSDIGAVWEVQSITNLVIDPTRRGRLLWRDAAFPKGHLNLRLNYTAGYTIGTGLNDLKHACFLTVQHMRRAQDRVMAGIASRSFEGQTVTYRDVEIPTEALGLLRKFVSYRTAA